MVQEKEERDMSGRVQNAAVGSVVKGPEVRPRWDKKRLQLLFVDNLAWVLIIVFYTIFAILRPEGMLKLSTLSFMLYSSIPLGFIVVGVSLCQLLGAMDLSLAEMTGFIAMLSAMIITKWFPGIHPVLCVLIPVVLGFIGGAINGYMVGYLGLNPFLATLGAFMAYEGGTLLLHSYPIYSGFPKLYMAIGRDPSNAVPLFFAFILLVAFILKYTPFGLHIYAVGGNKRSAAMLGLNPARITFFTFSLAGGFAGLAALFYTGYLHSVPPSMADGDIFMAFAGAIIGGIEQQGGRGSIINVLAGIIFLALVEAGLSMFNVNPYLRRVIFGLLVVVAIVINKTRNYFRDRILQTA